MSYSIRVIWVCILLFTFFSSFYGKYGGIKDEDNKKNVVLIVSDDHGLDAGCYGNEIIQTPNIDRLAEEGTRFTHAYATTASCTASRSVILSGYHNHRTGLFGHMHFPNHFRAYENMKTLPILMRENGYRTAIMGKFHVAPKDVFDFDEFLSVNSLADDKIDYAKANFGRNPVMMAEACTDFIAKKSDKPFFLYFCTSDPHRSNDEDKPNRFGNSDDDVPGVKKIKYSPDEVIVPYYLPDTKESREELAEYYQSVSRVDQGVGKLMEILKENDVYKNSLIIYMSDHGAAFPGAKTTTYEAGLNSPLIVRAPDAVKRGIITDAMVSWADITPTIADYSGIEPPSGYTLDPTTASNEAIAEPWHGRSFLPVLELEESEGFDEVYASHTFHEIQMYYPMRVVRDRAFKLIWNIAHQLPYPFASDLWAAQTWQAQYKKGMDADYGQKTVGEYINRPEFEFYNIKNDPWETKNLAGNPEYADLLEKYQQKLKEFQEKTHDRWIRKWDYE